MKDKRGSVLVHVLITTVIVIVIATGLAQMLMLRYAATLRATDGVLKRREDEGVLARVTAYWAQTGNFCSSPPGTPAIVCAAAIPAAPYGPPSGPTCAANTCVCSVNGRAGAIQSVADGSYYPTCQIQFTSAQ